MVSDRPVAVLRFIELAALKPSFSMRLASNLEPAGASDKDAVHVTQVDAEQPGAAGSTSSRHQQLSPVDARIAARLARRRHEQATAVERHASATHVATAQRFLARATSAAARRYGAPADNRGTVGCLE